MHELKITDLVINLVNEPDSKVKAVCDVTLNSALLITGFRIEEGKHGLTVTCPQPVLKISDYLVQHKITSRILSSYVMKYCLEE